ncbi:small subunit processome component 20 homolog [Oppia nitens]|uniref:small subunit processome component 20 homolog n=1 Tax=Oppia nitens TaxID=1686743 RepID=UPI0023D9A5F8|nr:small subunit processome component 20 homolog [Oppia nitens]
MKTKPVSHKLDNTFKFESFNDRLSKVNVSLLHNVKKGVNNVDIDDNITYFAITYEKWFDLNCSQHFDDLRRSIGTIVSVQTLPQIINRKNELIDILVANLQINDNLANDVVLELIVSLARDLNTDFYEYFDRLFASLADLLNTTDTDLIENCFVCLTFLFKYLSKYINKEFDKNYHLFEKLLESKKSYIREFTSESVSFLLRKANNKSTIINTLFDSVINNPKLVEGIGQLLFQTIKGVNKNFNSFGKSFIDLLFVEYYKRNHKCLDETIAYMFRQIIEFISKDNSELIWKSLLIDSTSETIAFKKVIPLLNLVIGYKNCHLVINSTKVINFLANCLVNHQLNEIDINIVLKSLSNMLFNCYSSLSTEDIELIQSNIFVNNQLTIDQISSFVSSVFNCSPFERIILPSLLTFCSKYLKTDCYESNDFQISLKLLTELILTKRRRPIYGKDVNTIAKYVLKFSDNLCQTMIDVMTKTIEPKILWSILVCLPNFIPINDKSSISLTIAKTIEELESRVSSRYCDNRWLGYCLVEAIIALIILKNNESIDELSPKFFIDLVNSNQHNTEVLQAFDLYLSFNKLTNKKSVDITILESIYKISLEKNLSSFCKVRRLNALHLMTLFDLPRPPCEDPTDVKSLSNIDICFESELIPNDLNQYRTKLRILQNLEYPSVKKLIPMNTIGGLNFDELPIHYMLGVLYENLSVLWQPIQRLIESYAKGYDNKRSVFDILFAHLTQTIQLIYSDDVFEPNYYQNDINNYLNSKHCMNNCFVNHLPNRPDYVNHRILVLKIFESVAVLVEPLNRELVPILFNFLDNEMMSQLIYAHNSRDDISGENKSLLMDIDLVDDDFDNNDSAIETSKSKISRKSLWKTFFTYLSIFAKFKNPKALYREKELLEIYLNLLISPDSHLQKHAFNCIISYKNSFMNDFNEDFLRLIDEKTFKSEIYSLILNTESDKNLLQNENREKIVPILMRILYGKMMAINGTKKHGKNTSDFRRSIILKVLSAFNQNELILFLDFVFAPIVEFIGHDYRDLHETIITNIDIKAMTPLRQMQAMIRTLAFVLKHLGNHSEAVTSYIFKVVVVVSTIVSHLLDNKLRQTINDHSVIRLKDIRSHCFKIITTFFETFDAYNYSSVEIDAIFESLIWPLLTHLDTESLTTSSPLLKFLNRMTQNSRYFKILAKRHPEDRQLTPISAIVKLYSNPKCQTSVITAITDLFNNLLILDNFSDFDEKNISQIIVNDCDLIMSVDDKNKDAISLGTAVLLPFTSDILNRIYVSYEKRKNETKASKKKKNSSFSEQELNILSRLSSYVTQSDESFKLIILLINSIDMNKNDEQKEYHTIKALVHLVKHLDHDINHILRSMIPLFSTISSCSSRPELCAAIEVLTQNDQQLSELAKIITNLNAYNPRFPEEPDFAKRLDAFKTINATIESITRNEFNFDFISIIFYNCIHFIKSCADLAIRESSVNTISIVLKKFEDFDDNNLFNEMVIKLLLYSTIAKGMRNKNETTRHELIDILLSMIEINGKRNPVLQQLALLCNKEDEEIDFWRNIKHIQIHRRTRALNRLAKNEELVKSLSQRIIIDFLIPLTTNFLTDEQYTKHAGLVSASTEAIGVFSKHIYWNKYYSQLKYYINLLIQQKGDQKINIKIISSILDNFSYKTFSQSNDSIDDTIIDDNEDIEMEDEEDNDNDIGMKINELKANELIRSYNKIYDAIVNNLLPLLNKCLHQKSQIEFAYDSLTKDEFPESKDSHRIAIALAIIKLLKSIDANPQVMRTNTTSVFLRLCHFLQSRAQSIRDLARNTFVKVMETLGPKYLMYALKEMRATLAKGYQRHVFVYTVHAILSGLKPQLKSGDLDKCLVTILEVCTLELFGDLSEEKDVSKITTKFKEAKKHKSYEIFQILGTFVSEQSLPQLLVPLKTTLSEAQNHKIVRKVSQCLSKVGQGLISNAALNEKTLLLFIYGLMNDMIPDLRLKTEDNKNNNQKKAIVERVDSFIIEKPIYQRVHKVAKIGETSNSHVIIEFALNSFLALIKQKRMEASNDEHLSLLDPFIELLGNILDAKDPKLTTLSLQSLYLMYTKFAELPSFGNHSENIMKTVFVLLHKYASFGITDRQDDNVQLVLLCFKTLSLFIKYRNDITISDNQMTVLLSYVDQDLSTETSQSTVFTILKSILHRRYQSKSLHRIMKRVAEMSVTSQSDSVKNNCTELSVKYLNDYFNGNNLTKRIHFYIKHLEYSVPAGRESALYVLNHIIPTLTYDFARKNMSLFFVALSSRLINETEGHLKKLVADLIIKLLKKLTQTDRNQLFNDIVIPWLKSSSRLQTLLASHLCSLFMTIEKNDFMNRLSHILPLIRQQLDPTRYESADEEDITKSSDSLVYQHMNLFIKVMKADPQFIKKSQFSDEVNTIFDYILNYHLLHPHLWVRVICTQIFGQLFSQYTIEFLADNANRQMDSQSEYLLSDTNDKLRQLTSKFCLLFRDIYNADIISEQIIKNLVFVSRFFIYSLNDNPKSPDFKWLTNKLIFEAKYEWTNSPHQTKKRICIIKWMAAVAVELGSDRLANYLPNFLPILCREETNSDNTSNDNNNNEVTVLVKQVLQLFKSIIGTERFSDYYTKARTKLTLKRLERKKNDAIESVTDVIQSAKRKIMKHQKLNESKKRKIANFKSRN